MQGNRSFPRSGVLATPRHCFRRPEGRSQSARGETSGDLQTLRECLERHLKQEAGEVEGGSSAPRPGSRLRDVRALRWEDGAGWSGTERQAGLSSVSQQEPALPLPPTTHPVSAAKVPFPSGLAVRARLAARRAQRGRCPRLGATSNAVPS